MIEWLRSGTNREQLAILILAFNRCVSPNMSRSLYISSASMLTNSACSNKEALGGKWNRSTFVLGKERP